MELTCREEQRFLPIHKCLVSNSNRSVWEWLRQLCANPYAPSHFLLPLPSQLTWVPNETQAADLVLLEFLERVDSPKAWLCKLWECVKPGGVLGVITSSTQWTSTNIQGIIGKW